MALDRRARPDQLAGGDVARLHLADRAEFAARADDVSIRSVADLDGKTVGVQAGGGSFAALANLRKLLAASGGGVRRVVQYGSFPEAYQDLANGRVDYVVNGVVNLTSLVKEQPQRFKLGSAVGVPTYAAWAVAKGNTTVLAENPTAVATTASSSTESIVVQVGASVTGPA